MPEILPYQRAFVTMYNTRLFPPEPRTRWRSFGFVLSSHRFKVHSIFGKFERLEFFLRFSGSFGTSLGLLKDASRRQELGF
jgi:hypothetical protein